MGVGTGRAVSTTVRIPPGVSFVFAAFAACLAALGTFVATAQAATTEGDARRGADLYAGRAALDATTTDGAPVPRRLAACVQCHRPSGLGGFEGGAAVPPIAARYLFEPFDPDTSGYFRSEARHRIRPAYDAAGLATMLRSGIAPDGHPVRAPMPRYRLDESDAADLAAYLRGLSFEPQPGIDATSVRVATITTPGVDAARADAMLTVLRAFEAGRNRQTRQEFQRSAQSRRSHEMVKDRKFRSWKLLHWSLEGEPDSWAAQLERLQASEPVFGIVAGMGAGDWSPVGAFCERHRLPCILPQIEQAPADSASAHSFYSLYFHAGLEQDLDLAIAALKQTGVRRLEVWLPPSVTEWTRSLVARRLQAAQLVGSDGGAVQAEAVLSLLPAEAHLERWRARSPAISSLAWVPGARWQSSDQWLAGTAGVRSAVIVSPLRPSDEAAASMGRARDWVRSNGLGELPLDVVTSTLLAATVFGESFAHLDFDFTREYVLELLEHRLESMPLLSPYPRLAIGPGQRVASKGSYVGTVHDGRVAWRWHAVASR